MAKESVCSAAKALTSLARTGWMIRGVPNCLAETVAEHSFLSALIALRVAIHLRRRGVDVDPEKAAIMALLHDIGEAVIGDVVKLFTDRIGAELKERIELETVRENFDSDIAEYIEEYVDASTLEAQVARFAEKLATLVKAKEYLRLGFRVEDIASNIMKSVESEASSIGVSVEEVERIIGCRIK